MLEISRQAVHQSRKRQKKFDMELSELVCQVNKIRTDHPGCGLEKIYRTLKPETMGRDKFCEIFMGLGYRVRKIKNYTRTTVPAWFDCPNLIEGMEVTAPHRVIQSDITYYGINGRCYYIVFIIDVYTREILGYHVGDSMRADYNVKALQKALKKVPVEDRKSMVHHSDRGAQYGSREYTKLLKTNGIKISMGERAQDNAYAERINGTIKNEYLKLWHITDLKKLKQKTKRAVDNYNNKRLHSAFQNRYAPKEFKKKLLSLGNQKRPKVFIYAKGNYKVRQASKHLDFKSEKEPKAHNCPIVVN